MNMIAKNDTREAERCSDESRMGKVVSASENASSGKARSVISVAGLSKAYGSFRAVDDVNFTIGRAEILTLLGPSGSGKTTTLMILAGLVAPDSGTIHLVDQDITYTPPAHRNMGVVFQSYALFPHMSALENVAFPLRARGVEKATAHRQAMAALAMTQLQGLEQRLPSQLSGGQQQRTALARSFVFQPPVLLMDEALGALDRNLRIQMQMEIKEYQRRLGFSIIHVTHDQEEALTMSDQVAVMSDGKVRQIGTPRDLYNHPRSSFVANFLGDANIIEGVALGMENGDVIADSFSGQRFAVAGNGKRFDKGDNIQICVRPERLSIANSGRLDGNSCEATVTEIRYLGSSIEYKVVDPGEKVIKIKTMSDINIDVGDSVKISWLKSGGHIINE